jgi:hypothetical protein
MSSNVVLTGFVEIPNEYYGRKWKILVELNDGKFIGDEHEGTSIDFSDFKVTFNCAHDIQNSLQTATVTIYNLNAETERLILSQGIRVYIEAGYVNPKLYGRIHYGNIRQVNRGTLNGTDKYIKIDTIKDPNRIIWGSAVISALRGSNYRQLIDRVAAANNLEVGDVPPNWGEDKKLSRGFSNFGSTKDLVSGIAASTNSIINIEDGKLNIIDVSQPYPGEAYDLNYKTGLIDTPQQTKEGVIVKTLINPQIKLNSWFHLNNEDIIAADVGFMELPNKPMDIDGLYRIIKQEFSGDTRGNDWYCTHTCFTQAGGMPEFITDSGQVAL